MRDVIPSPNIWHTPAVYELENKAVDPEGRLAEALLAHHSLTDAHVLDIGCGTGFYLPRFAQAAHVTGVEPHPPLVTAARRRTAGLENVTVLHGTAQHLPVPSASIDIAHARWAYFFGPGCEPGLRELTRVMRRGGVALLIDNDLTRSTFGAWCRRAWPNYRPDEVERFFALHGFRRQSIDMGWCFENRRDLEAVLRIEFEARYADQFIAEHSGLEVDYAVNVWSKTY